MAYDRSSYIGRLYKALDEAQAKGWTVADMKRDWNIVFWRSPQMNNSNMLEVRWSFGGRSIDIGLSVCR